MSVIANNRFLQRTNPTMLAAIDDGGSVLDRVFIQHAARDMVDRDIWKHLFGWYDDGLVETRTSGSDLYVPKCYDLSGNGHDAEQTSTGLQPLLTSTGMQFADTQWIANTGVNAELNGSSAVTVQFWVYPTSFSSNRNYCFLFNNGTNVTLSFQFWRSTGRMFSFLRSQAADTVQQILSASGTTGTLNTWQMITVIADCTNKWLRIYRNTTKVAEGTSLSLGSDTFVSTSQISYIMGHPTTGASLVGKMRDIRSYKADLEDEITTSFNNNKSRYGL